MNMCQMGLGANLGAGGGGLQEVRIPLPPEMTCSVIIKLRAKHLSKKLPLPG